MRRIRKTDTGPEMIVRRMVHAMGYRYRLHGVKLPGTPDIVLPRHRKVIFVHGCFWHRHDCPDGRKLPSRSRSTGVRSWNEPAERCDERRSAAGKLEWTCWVLWECELGDVKKLSSHCRRF